MLSPYRINPNNTNKRTKKVLKTNFNNDSYHEPDNERPRMTSNDFKTNQTKPNQKNKTVLNAGSLQEDIGINEHYLYEILDKNNI